MTELTGLRQTPFFRALHRPNLFLGGERELMLMTVILCVGVAFASLNLVSLLVGAGVWLIVSQLLRLMAKSDPMLSKVYRRHITYQTYYPARSRPWRRT